MPLMELIKTPIGQNQPTRFSRSRHHGCTRRGPVTGATPTSLRQTAFTAAPGAPLASRRTQRIDPDTRLYSNAYLEDGRKASGSACLSAMYPLDFLVSGLMPHLVLTLGHQGPLGKDMRIYCTVL